MTHSSEPTAGTRDGRSRLGSIALLVAATLLLVARRGAPAPLDLGALCWALLTLGVGCAFALSRRPWGGATLAAWLGALASAVVLPDFSDRDIVLGALLTVAVAARAVETARSKRPASWIGIGAAALLLARAWRAIPDAYEAGALTSAVAGHVGLDVGVGALAGLLLYRYGQSTHSSTAWVAASAIAAWGIGLEARAIPASIAVLGLAGLPPALRALAVGAHERAPLDKLAVGGSVAITAALGTVSPLAAAAAAAALLVAATDGRSGVLAGAVAFGALGGLLAGILAGGAAPVAGGLARFAALLVTVLPGVATLVTTLRTAPLLPIFSLALAVLGGFAHDPGFWAVSAVVLAHGATRDGVSSSRGSRATLGWAAIVGSSSLLLGSYPWLRQTPWLELAGARTLGFALAALLLWVASGGSHRYRRAATGIACLVWIVLLVSLSPSTSLLDEPTQLGPSQRSIRLPLGGDRSLGTVVLDGYLSNTLSLDTGDPVVRVRSMHRGTAVGEALLRHRLDIGEWAAERADVEQAVGPAAPEAWRRAAAAGALVRQYRFEAPLGSSAADAVDVELLPDLPGEPVLTLLSVRAVGSPAGKSHDE